MTKRNRQLAAIVFTDIVGYSAMMRRDERLAMEVRKRHRAVFDSLTPRYGGRILQYYGDGTLSIFDSSVAAVECAVEMQREFRQDPAVPLRIGIHTGDITYDETDIYGDGVNLAARIEPCCNTGGIFMTGKVFDDIKNHEWLCARTIGSFEFKGMNEPVSLFAVDNEGVRFPDESDIRQLTHSEAKLVTIHPAPVQPKAPVPERIRQIALVSIPILLLGLLLLNVLDRPFHRTSRSPMPHGVTSIAVLPFDNFGGGSTDDYFSDGITEDILTLLSQIRGLNVVSRTSVMKYKDSEKDIRQIGRELNADHILEGSVRRDGNKVRIVAQLIDARTDNHVWSHTYDQEMTRIFEVQSNVAQDIAAALKKTLSERERAEIWKKPTNNVKAYEYYLRGREYYVRYTDEANDKAIELFQKALKEDPAFAQAYAGLGDALAQKAFKNENDELLLDSAIAMSIHAIELDGELSEGYKALGLAYHYRGWHEKALEEYRKAVDRNPNNGMAVNNIGAIYQEQGKLLDALQWARRALQINPRHNISLINLAKIYYLVGDDEQCMELLRRGMQYDAGYFPFQELMAAVYLRNNELPAAKEIALHLIAEGTGHPEGYHLMGEISLLEGNYKEAGVFFEEAKRLSPEAAMESDPLETEMKLAFIEIKTGNAVLGKTRMEALRQKFRERAVAKANGYHDLSVSMASAILGEKEVAFDWLEKAVNHHFVDYRIVENHPFFESIRSDPRFRQLLNQVKNKVRQLQKEVGAVSPEGQMI